MKQTRLIVLVFLIIHSISYAQGKIKKAEKNLNQEKSSGKTTTSTTTYSNNNSDTKNNYVKETIGGIFVQLFAYTAYGLAIESPFEFDHKSSSAFLTKHPYNNANTGNYSYNWTEDTEIFTTTISNRLIYESNTVYGNHLNLNMRFLKRMELELDFLQLWEHNQNFGNNTLAIYTALAKYNRIRTEKFNASWGLGATYVAGDVKKLGFTYGIGAELFFVKPFSLEANFNQALINNESINKFNTLLNYHKKQYKFILGYEHLRIARVPFSNFTAGFGLSL